MDSGAQVGFLGSEPWERLLEHSTAALPPVRKKPVTLLVALALSKATWLAALHSPAADKVSLHHFASGDAQELLTLIKLKRDQAQAAWHVRST